MHFLHLENEFFEVHIKFLHLNMSVIPFVLHSVSVRVQGAGCRVPAGHMTYISILKF